MEWDGDRERFLGWCAETTDLRAFAAATASIPAAAWAELLPRLRALLAEPGPGEAGSGHLRRDTPLAERLTSPVAILSRQVRLEKIRIVEARTAV